MTRCLSTEGIGDRRPAAMAQGSHAYFHISDEIRTFYILNREILKEQYPLLRTDGSGARYIGIHIRELGIPESLAKTYDKAIYKCL